MALKFQYNKTTIQQFRKQLAIREKALPILKSKETALRKEEKDTAYLLAQLRIRKNELVDQLVRFQPFWGEFPNIVTLNLEKTGIYQKKIVGVKVPEIGEITFELIDMSWWNYPAWVPSGIDIMQKSIATDLKIRIKEEQKTVLNAARKKTTQKVNLYEKVQIPGYEDAIIKIRRFLEDKENISKAAQKIVKKKKDWRVET
jgi:V/A-type H+-transporting ATPase subunit D